MAPGRVTASMIARPVNDRAALTKAPFVISTLFRVVVAHLHRRLCDAHLDPGTERLTGRPKRLGTPDPHGRPVKGTVAGVSGSHVSLGWHPLKRQFHLTGKDQRQLTTAIGSEDPATSLRKAGETEAPAEPPGICLARCFLRCPVRGKRYYPVNIALRRFSLGTRDPTEC